MNSAIKFYLESSELKVFECMLTAGTNLNLKLFYPSCSHLGGEVSRGSQAKTVNASVVLGVQKEKEVKEKEGNKAWKNRAVTSDCACVGQTVRDRVWSVCVYEQSNKVGAL